MIRLPSRNDTITFLFKLIGVRYVHWEYGNRYQWSTKKYTLRWENPYGTRFIELSKNIPWEPCMWKGMLDRRKMEYPGSGIWTNSMTIFGVTFFI